MMRTSKIIESKNCVKLCRCTFSCVIWPKLFGNTLVNIGGRIFFILHNFFFFEGVVLNSVRAGCINQGGYYISIVIGIGFISDNFKKC